MEEAQFPGWHVDPEHPNQERFWDGTKWTDQWRTLAPEHFPPGPDGSIDLTVAEQAPNGGMQEQERLSGANGSIDYDQHWTFKGRTLLIGVIVLALLALVTSGGDDSDYEGPLSRDDAYAGGSASEDTDVSHADRESIRVFRLAASEALPELAHVEDSMLLRVGETTCALASISSTQEDLTLLLIGVWDDLSDEAKQQIYDDDINSYVQFSAMAVGSFCPKLYEALD